MSKEDQIRAVARYLEGDMESEEAREFSLLLEKEVTLQKLLRSYQDIHQTLKMRIAPDAEDEMFRESLSTLNKTYFKGDSAKVGSPEAQTVVSTDQTSSTHVKTDEITGLNNEVKAVNGKTIALNQYVKWLSVAAVLVIGLFVWAPWSTNLYEEYAISREIAVTERGTAEESALAKAAVMYNAGDFAAALKVLAPAYHTAPENAQVAYYYGITLIEQNKFVEARTILLKLYDGESVFKYDAVYNLGLSYVKENNKKDAIKWLEKVPEGSASYQKAKALIEKLK